MFHSARLKLTAWYLLIIMVISIFFSVAFYQTSTREIQRAIRRIEARDQLQFGALTPFLEQLRQPLEENLIEAEQRLQILLLLINLGIFTFAGGIGYFLAGKTLKPIQEMLEQQHRFITDSSHELRTPLTALRAEMEAGLLDKNMDSKEARRLITSNLEEVIQLQNLSDNLLQLAQYQNQNKQTVTYHALSLQQIIEDSLKKVLPLAKKKHINIINSISDTTFFGDNISLTQLFVILLDNAIKYSSEKTKIFLSSRKIENTIEISVADQGMGIDKKDIPHIFDRFYRTDSSRTKTKNAGYGLGLAIAKRIVDEHNGEISIKSQINIGTTFTIQIPTADHS